VTLEVPIGPERRVLSVHKDAIVNRQGKDIVFVAKGDEVQARPVRLGAAVGSRMEVLDGLGEGEQVVVRGNERLRSGAKVQVVGES
jgi:multidrug efflux pump subunit AcrA (membrane-fusion protein)